MRRIVLAAAALALPGPAFAQADEAAVMEAFALAMTDYGCRVARADEAAFEDFAMARVAEALGLSLETEAGTEALYDRIDEAAERMMDAGLIYPQGDAMVLAGCTAAGEGPGEQGDIVAVVRDGFDAFGCTFNQAADEEEALLAFLAGYVSATRSTRIDGPEGVATDALVDDIEAALDALYNRGDLDEDGDLLILQSCSAEPAAPSEEAQALAFFDAITESQRADHARTALALAPDCRIASFIDQAFYEGAIPDLAETLEVPFDREPYATELYYVLYDGLEALAASDMVAEGADGSLTLTSCEAEAPEATAEASPQALAIAEIRNTPSADLQDLILDAIVAFGCRVDAETNAEFEVFISGFLEEALGIEAGLLETDGPVQIATRDILDQAVEAILADGRAILDDAERSLTLADCPAPATPAGAETPETAPAVEEAAPEAPLAPLPK